MSSLFGKFGKLGAGRSKALPAPANGQVERELELLDQAVDELDAKNERAERDLEKWRHKWQSGIREFQAFTLDTGPKADVHKNPPQNPPQHPSQHPPQHPFQYLSFDSDPNDYSMHQRSSIAATHASSTYSTPQATPIASTAIPLEKPITVPSS